MDEAFVDVRGCDYSNLDLTDKVFSGVLMRSANFSNSKFVGVEFARADAKSANLSNADFTDANVYSSIFDGANLENAQFENSILTGMLPHTRRAIFDHLDRALGNSMRTACLQLHTRR